MKMVLNHLDIGWKNFQSLIHTGDLANILGTPSGGDFDILISSIKNTLFRLDDDVIIYPGHGPSTTIIDEINENPFLN